MQSSGRSTRSLRRRFFRVCTERRSTSCASTAACSSCPADTILKNITPVRIRILMLEYDFMRHAFAAATIVALVAGTVGYFLVLRGQTFAGHALSHVGFTGATGAVLIGVPP